LILAGSLIGLLVACAEAPYSPSPAAPESAVPAAGWPSQPRCVADELTLFACDLVSGKSVALCASPDATEHSGYVRFAYGTGDAVQRFFPESVEAPGDRFRSTRVLFPTGNGRLTYSLDVAGSTYALYQTWSARDGRQATGGLTVVDADGAASLKETCQSMGDAEQEALADSPYEMPNDERFGEVSRLDFIAEKE
jgi:hypothetical protein